MPLRQIVLHPDHMNFAYNVKNQKYRPDVFRFYRCLFYCCWPRVCGVVNCVLAVSGLYFLHSTAGAAEKIGPCYLY